MAPTPRSKKDKKKKSKNKLVGVSKRPNRRLFTYKEEDLMSAIESIRNKAMGIRQACRFYGVPFATVHDRISGKVAINKKPKVGPDPVLGVKYEEKLKIWIIDMAKCGFPVNKAELIESVSKIIAESGIKTPFKDGVPGETWYQNFLKRHPDISIREPEGINNARAAITENRIKHWFKELKQYVESIGAEDIFEDPDRIFNGDEAGFSLCPKTGKVLGPKGFKNLYIRKNNDKESLTVLIVFTASGKLCPPLVVFPYIRPPKALTDSMPESWVLGRSESGWMKSDVFYEYVTNDFNSWVEKNQIKKPIILFVDGHKSHMTYALSDFCQSNGIILYALPPNSTHMLQPADVSVFRPLKQNWKKTVKQWQSEHTNEVVTKINFCSILNNTITQTNLNEAIKNGFKRCGLYPLDEQAVDYSKCVKDTQEKVATDRQKRQSCNDKNKANAREFDAALKIITLIKTDLEKRNIESQTVIEEIEIAKAKYLENRRSKSKTPRNSAASNQSTSIITQDIDITPENIGFDEPVINPILDASQHNEYVTDETIDENISFLQPGSYISLNNISVMPLDEIQISHLSPISPELPENQAYTLTVSADVHNSNTAHNDFPQTSQGQFDQILSFDDIFNKHLHFPETSAPKGKKRNGPKLPSAISSQAWREHYKKKDEEKENENLQKKRRLQLRAEEREKKTKEKENTKKKKKTLKKKPKKTTLQCSECSGELISDIEDDSEKNVGCDNCIRWFHLKCTEMRNATYAEAAVSSYTCQFCHKDGLQN